MIRVIRQTFGTLLVAAVGRTPRVEPTLLAAPLAAVPVAAITRPADHERRVAPHAAEQVQEDADDQRLAQDLHPEWTSRRVGGMLRTPKSLPAQGGDCRTLPRLGCNPPGLLFGGAKITSSQPGAPSARMTDEIYRLLVRKLRFLVTAHTIPHAYAPSRALQKARLRSACISMRSMKRAACREAESLLVLLRPPRADPRQQRHDSNDDRPSVLGVVGQQLDRPVARANPLPLVVAICFLSIAPLRVSLIEPLLLQPHLRQPDRVRQVFLSRFVVSPARRMLAHHLRPRRPENTPRSGCEGALNDEPAVRHEVTRRAHRLRPRQLQRVVV